MCILKARSWSAVQTGVQTRHIYAFSKYRESGKDYLSPLSFLQLSFGRSLLHHLQSNRSVLTLLLKKCRLARRLQFLCVLVGIVMRRALPHCFFRDTHERTQCHQPFQLLYAIRDDQGIALVLVYPLDDFSKFEIAFTVSCNLVDKPSRFRRYVRVPTVEAIALKIIDFRLSMPSRCFYLHISDVPFDYLT